MSEGSAGDSFPLPFGLVQLDGTVSIGRPVVYDHDRGTFNDAPVRVRSLRAAYRVPAADAVAFMRKLRSILRYLGTCDGNMEQGSMRCDINVSVRPVGENALRPRAEVKNVNSIRYVMQAIEHEAERDDPLDELVPDDVLSAAATELEVLDALEDVADDLDP